MRSSVLIQFPGLGGYAPGILARLVADSPRLGAVLSEVDAVAAGYGFGPVSGPLTDPDGPPIEDLAQTPTLLHLASFASSYLLYQALHDKGIDGDVLLGHSTGELTALAAAGALSVPDTARVLCEREVALAEAGIGGGLVAVRVGARHAEYLCGAAGGWSLLVSLSNSPEQTVVSGCAQDLPRFEAVAQAAGVQATRLLVRYPHHNPVLQTAARRVTAAVAAYQMHDPAARVYSPILGRWVTGAADVRRIVERHLIDPVDYLRALRTLYDGFAVREFIEVGVRPVLTESARESLPTGATFVGPPPNACDAQEILNVLASTGEPEVAARVASASASAVAETSGEPGPGATTDARSLPDRDTLLARLRTMFAETLGYPEDVFTDDAHLEADLGIASVKKTELLVRLLDEYQLPTPPARLRMRDYTTLPKLAALMETLAVDGAKP
ncbi:acyltransferase domain-containing protein [Nocardia ninae]|uniref:Carrier domain-containing protein n=1 Tax=Nocardia ninae NBRC 108245 TaxID=1210091 RepID=A0A511MH29_9NOCA|nr:acyltransferase domain-containing protein [Nocardia ninae]GEM39945.1 hypothetical protein NN4_44640 [Nocardia ninae NBRC 108245]